MKKLILLLLLIPLVSFGQDVKVCSYNGYLTLKDLNEACNYKSYLGNVDAEKVVDNILKKVGLNRNFILKECPNIDNAAAASVVSPLGGLDRYIIYDKNFLNKIEDNTGTDWGAVSVLAHEIGHHLNGHTLNSSVSNHDQELQADEFSGFVLAKMGSTLKNATSAISIYGSSVGSSSHPPKDKRIKSIEIGWNNGFSGYDPIQNESSININLLEPDIEKENIFVNSAISANKIGNFSQAGKLLHSAYELSGNEDYLYYSASSYVNAKSYRDALKYYLFLIKKGYTGISLKYYITEKKSKKEIIVSETEFNLFKNSKKYINPRLEYSDSRQPEIFKNTSLIYVQLRETEKAIFSMKKARETNPDDLNLLLSEADLYIKIGDKEKFMILMQEAIKRDPNNAILYYNLGVINEEQEEFDAAMNFYKKSIELDPNYAASYLNLVGLILQAEGPIVERMNVLATSNKRSDNEKYDNLASERISIYKSALPFLEKLLEFDSNNIEAIETAVNIYIAIGDKRNQNKFSKKLKSLGLY